MRGFDTKESVFEDVVYMRNVNSSSFLQHLFKKHQKNFTEINVNMNIFTHYIYNIQAEKNTLLY